MHGGPFGVVVVNLLRFTEYRTTAASDAAATAAGHAVSRVSSRGASEHAERSSSSSSSSGIAHRSSSSLAVFLHLQHLYVVVSCLRLAVSGVCQLT